MMMETIRYVGNKDTGISKPELRELETEKFEQLCGETRARFPDSYVIYLIKADDWASFIGNANVNRHVKRLDPQVGGKELSRCLRGSDRPLVLETIYASPEGLTKGLTAFFRHPRTTSKQNIAFLQIRNHLFDHILRRPAEPTTPPLKPPTPDPPRGELRGADAFLGVSKHAQHVRDLVRRAARSDSRVLILGETGTGKEVVAKAIHEESSRRDQPFVAENMTAIPKGLFEDTFFGHVRGSFPDAIADKPGLFEEADGGTIVLDEIGDLPLAIQPKMLRVLDDGKIRRIGDTKWKKVDVRVIAATNADLKLAIAQRLFRLDLFHRLAVTKINIPPLRMRIQDIEELSLAILRRFTADKKATLPLEVVEALKRHDWPGNVRELENVIARYGDAIVNGEEPGRAIQQVMFDILSERTMPTEPVSPHSDASDSPPSLEADASKPHDQEALVEIMARASHGAWLIHALSEGGDNPDLKQWGDLPEESRRFSRGSTRAILTRLIMMGKRIELSEPPKPASERFAEKALEPILEALAEAGHTAWFEIRAAERDTIYGPARDDTSKPRINPYFLPWKDLPEERRGSARREALTTITELLLQGYEIV